MRRSVQGILLGCVMFMAAGCAVSGGGSQTGQAIQPQIEAHTSPKKAFQDYQKIPLAIGSIQIEKTYNPEATPNNRSAVFPVSPAQALETYLNQRFTIAADAVPGTLIFTIEDASLPVSIVQSDQRLLSLFELGQSGEYTLNYRLKIEQKDVMGRIAVQNVLNYQKSVSFPISYSLARLEKEYLEFLQNAIAELDQSVVSSIDKNFNLRGRQSFFEQTDNPDLFKGYVESEDDMMVAPPQELLNPVIQPYENDGNGQAINKPIPLN